MGQLRTNVDQSWSNAGINLASSGQTCAGEARASRPCGREPGVSGMQAAHRRHEGGDMSERSRGGTSMRKAASDRRSMDLHGEECLLPCDLLPMTTSIHSTMAALSLRSAGQTALRGSSQSGARSPTSSCTSTSRAARASHACGGGRVAVHRPSGSIGCTKTRPVQDFPTRAETTESHLGWPMPRMILREAPTRSLGIVLPGS